MKNAAQGPVHHTVTGLENVNMIPKGETTDIMIENLIDGMIGATTDEIELMKRMSMRLTVCIFPSNHVRRSNAWM